MPHRNLKRYDVGHADSHRDLMNHDRLESIILASSTVFCQAYNTGIANEQIDGDIEQKGEAKGHAVYPAVYIVTCSCVLGQNWSSSRSHFEAHARQWYNYPQSSKRRQLTLAKLTSSSMENPCRTSRTSRQCIRMSYRTSMRRVHKLKRREHFPEI